MDYPLVSVVLVVRNEESKIRRILEQIYAQDYPVHLVEVIVVDGQSDDRTAGIASSFSHCGRMATVIRLAELGRSRALNQGIRTATGEVIVRVDARTSIARDYISRCVETLERTSADNVGGVQRPIATSRQQEAIGLALSHPFGVGNAQFRLGKRSGYVDSVYLGCFRREIFDKIGFFDEQAAVISEDSDINQRIRNAGGKIYLNKDIVAHYYPRETFLDFWKLYYRYGGARAGNLLKHKNFTSWRQTIPPLFLLSLVSAVSLSIFVDYRFSYFLLGVLGAYLAANASASSAIGFQRGKPYLMPLLMGAFACMHFAWALGFWHRLITPTKPGSYWSN